MLNEVHFPDAIVIGLRIDHTGGVILTLHLIEDPFMIIPFYLFYSSITLSIDVRVPDTGHSLLVSMYLVKSPSLPLIPPNFLCPMAFESESMCFFLQQLLYHSHSSDTFWFVNSVTRIPGLCAAVVSFFFSWRL